MGEDEGWYSRGEGFLVLKVASESAGNGGWQDQGVWTCLRVVS